MTKEILVQRDFVVQLAEMVQMEPKVHKDQEDDLVHLVQPERVVNQDLQALSEQRDQQVYLVTLEMKGVVELLGPRENKEPRAPWALEGGPAQEGHRENQVIKEMLEQLVGGEWMDDQASRVTRALQDLWDLPVILEKREQPEVLVYLERMGDREIRDPRDDQENEDQ